MTLAENVKHHQELKDMTTVEFAEKANLPADTINKIRAGTTQNPNMETLKRMAAALDCTIDQLAGVERDELEDVRELLPEQMPADPEAMVALFCKTLRQQTINHEKTMAEIRKDRNWWRGAALGIMCTALLLLIIAIIMVSILYWDLSHPTEGNIIYSIMQGAMH